MKTVTLIASGQMAAALTFPLTENGHRVRLVGSPLDTEIITGLKNDNYHTTLRRRLPAGIEYYYVEEFEAAMVGADLVVCGVSSFGVDWFLETVIPKIPAGVPLLSVTKGMIVEEDGTMISYPEYWQKHLPADSNLDIYAIGGPCTARGLSDHDATAVAFCGADMAVMEELKKIFTTDYYLINLTNDVRGLEGAVALKNGYALGTALAIGLATKIENPIDVHYNAQAALFQQATKEMMELLALMGGGAENIIYGVGDLYVTVMGGRSRTVGVLLGEGYTMAEVEEKMAGETLEAVVIARRIAQAVKILDDAGQADKKDFPLLMHVDSLLSEGAAVNIPWHDFETIVEKA